LNRLRKTFERLHRDGKRALIPFITAGDPDLQTTTKLLVELAHSGASVIELGVPFSDPIADGPVIQRASIRALRNRVDVKRILEVVTDVRRETDVPIVLFSYFNPLLQFGTRRLSEEASRAGVDGVLVTDLAPEAAHEFSADLAANDLDFISLVAPTSTDERLALIAERATGFMYAVSRTGVTGTRSEIGNEAEKLVARMRRVTNLPIAVGFGISTRAQALEVWRYADAAVVGSAVVAEIERLATAPDLVKQIGGFVHALLPQEQLVASPQQHRLTGNGIL
jgi:tryptophan synthase alpha chain